MEASGENHMFTEEAVSAFRSAIKEDDFEPLSRIFRDKYEMADIRRQLVLNHGIGMSDEERMINRARMALNLFALQVGDEQIPYPDAIP